ncbi:MAG: hypothetical protein A4E35_00854 [Methanoregula sp. PtaU1.Bin051]|nr:MAG: hypothetical protein A4E35_00854 [Methanoregula sp. PtaU1.Bin051]
MRAEGCTAILMQCLMMRHVYGNIQILTRKNGVKRLPKKPFEEVTEIKYRPEITERTEEEARRGILEGEAFLVLEIQVIGMVENFQGKDSLTIDYLAACNEKALSSRWMEEKICLLTKVCEDTVMAIPDRTTARLFIRIKKRKDSELCLYRLSAWLSMGDDGSERWSIRDKIDPLFEQEDQSVGKRAAEARRLAAIVMERKAG